jgi:hypothetical protein
MTARRSVAVRRPLVRVAVSAAVGCLAVLAGAVVAGCSSSPDRSAPSLADVRAVLARHGTAVLHHDRTAFADDLDPTQQAAGFRVRQLDEFANLVRLPFATWSYHLEGRTDFHEAERRATKRFGTGAVIVRLAVRFAFRDIDRQPTQHELWWTFVRHDGKTVIATDDSLLHAGGAGWQGPWDFGRLEILRGAHSLVLGHPEAADALRQVQATVEAAVPAVTAVWGSDWAQRVAVVVPASDAELAAQGGESSQVTTDVAALTVSDGTDPLTGAVYGQRLIVNPAALARLSDVGRQIVIRHEITHIASAAATTAASPQWLIEGFADYVGNLHTGQPVTTVASELRADVRNGKVPQALPTADAFATEGQAAQAYEGSWLACRLIAQRAGQTGLVRFYRMVGASSLDQDAAVAAALGRILHETTAQFTADWRRYVTDQLS